MDDVVQYEDLLGMIVYLDEDDEEPFGIVTQLSPGKQMVLIDHNRSAGRTLSGWFDVDRLFFEESPE